LSGQAIVKEGADLTLNSGIISNEITDGRQSIGIVGQMVILGVTFIDGDLMKKKSIHIIGTEVLVHLDIRIHSTPSI
jgi:hypothetical protein